MRYEDVKSVVGAEVDVDLDDLYESFKRIANTADLDKFVAHLHDTGLISEHTFRELHGREHVDVMPFATLADDLVATRGGTMFPDDLEAGNPAQQLVPDVPALARYSYLGKIGQGAMGEVHVAVDLNLNRKIAFKQMTHKTAGVSKLAGRFFQEAQITAQLDHPNIVPIYALEASPDGRLGYAMKLIRGRTFQELVQQVREHHAAGTPLPNDLTLTSRLEHFLKVCDAIEFAHSRGVVHRDLKPENIMVGPFNEVYVMDWGIARRIDDVEELIEAVEITHTDTGGHKTKVGSVIGTPAYMSPEQAEGRNDDLDGRSDLFSLGLILYELVALKRAITGKTAMAMVLRIQDADLDPLEHTAGVPIHPGLAAIIAKATQKEPDHRYANLDAFAEDLRRWLRGDEVLAKPDTFIEKIGRWTRSHLALVGGTVGTAMLALFALIIAMLAFNLYSLQAAEKREQALGGVLNTVSRQGAFIDGHLLGYEGLLEVLAGTALESLEHGRPGPVPAFVTSADFEAPDLLDSSRYQRKVSQEWPVFRVADPKADVAADLYALVNMRDQYRRVLLQSARSALLFAPRETQDRFLFEQGVPFAWAHIALDTGLYSVYPGHGGVPPGFDPRRRPWYEMGAEATGPKWGNPHVDMSGLGLVLPCSAPLIDDDGSFRGVASVEVTFDYVIDRLLESPALSDKAESFILDNRARIVIRSSESREVESAPTGRTLRLKRFPVSDLADALRGNPSGYLAVEHEGVDQLIVYYRMDSLGWYYVIMGESARLLDAG